MAKTSFTSSEWNKIFNLVDSDSEKFGLPKSRNKSVVIGTFNIRKLGKFEKRSAGAWKFLNLVCERFDLLAIQEVMDDLEGLRHIKEQLAPNFGLVASDVTGVFPGSRGNAERLAFLFNWKRIERTELASDITYDRSKIVSTLFENRQAYQKAWEDYVKKLGAWEERCKVAKEDGRRKPSKPALSLPTFLTFIRQPLCVSFRVLGKNDEPSFDFLVVNAHLLYGTNPRERKWEFDALVDWLTVRAKQSDKLYHKNLLLLGDCNLEFDDVDVKREEIDDRLKRLNKEYLKSKKAAEANFPLLDEHPKNGLLRTNLRQTQTYDQIGIFAHDKRLPDSSENETAGSALNSFDYGVFNMADLFSNALHGKNFEDLTKVQKKSLIKKSENDVSDHMPAWFRLPIPGA